MKLNIDLNELSLEELKTVIKLADKQNNKEAIIEFGTILAENEEKRKAGRPLGVRNKKKKINKHWSTYELNRLKSMMDAHYSDKKMAKELNRTIPSIASMVWKLKVNYDRHNLKTLNPMKPMKNKKVLTRWTNKEIRLLETYYKQGVHYATIAKELGRTAKAVNNKLYHLRLK